MTIEGILGVPYMPNIPAGFGSREPDLQRSGERGTVLSFPTVVVLPGEVHSARIHADGLTKLTRFYCEAPSDSLLIVGMRVGGRAILDPTGTRGGLAGIGIARVRDEQAGRLDWPTLLPGEELEIRVRHLWTKRRVWLVAGFWAKTVAL